ncbi:MAG TPA: M1 family metallopeptidase, partial [Chitinophagaceae bacterium]|nr:M1 family metallopeptidase [Chitinophagaceae bacterium]
MSRLFLFPTLCLFIITTAAAQPSRWQQHVKYSMDVTMDVASNKFTGKQKLLYTNNSPDTLTRLFYHLYWNAFQPNSMMDNRSRVLGQQLVNGRPDWDGRVRDRILHLQPDEIGYQQVKWIKMNGVAQTMKQHETILEVVLTSPVLPKATVTLDLEFAAQVPVQIRRSGRDNAEGVRYSMSQWYPKLCEYDYEGWHPTPYVAREFYGVWGDYDVNITIDKKYLLAATGYLQNANQVGFGYETPGTKVPPSTGKTITWKFTAPNVHDFVWAADPDYIHISKPVRDGMVLHAFYKISPEALTKQFEAFSAKQQQQYGNNAKNFIDNYREEWETVLENAAKVLPFMDKTFGKYPYKQYSFIQGGDGGMEYPMATLLKGAGTGVVFHEWMHSWYQMMMGTNESEYAWMDEGFTSYAEDLVTRNFYGKSTAEGYREALQRNPSDKNLAQALTFIPEDHGDSYNAYFSLVKSGLEEPLTTHADHFNTNYAYSNAAYAKGAVFMEQLGYIVGADMRNTILLDYYHQWRFKHPNVNDLIQVGEKASGIKLDWYREYFVQTTKTIDYGIDSLWEEGGITKIRMVNKGKMPMPIDLELTFKDGSKEMHYVPMNLMFGSKAPEGAQQRKVYNEWNWTNPSYVIETSRKLTD